MSYGLSYKLRKRTNEAQNNLEKNKGKNIFEG